MRLDPSMSRGEALESLIDRARQTWGEAELTALRTALGITADALWRIAQEQIELADEGPWEA